MDLTFDLYADLETDHFGNKEIKLTLSTYGDDGLDNASCWITKDMIKELLNNE